MSFQFPALARTARQLATCAAWLAAFADPAVADTPLYDNGRWAVVGATDPGPDPSDIAVSIDGVPAGSFSELKLYFGFTGAGFPQVFSITGRGAMRASLPPPGEFGGSFWLTRYWDCAIGLVPSLVITQLNLVVDTKHPQGLNFQGAVSNLTSFGASDLRLRFPAPSFNEVMVEVSYTLVATRDFCVDSSRQSLEEGFQVARMTTTFIDNNEKLSDFFRYNTRLVGCNGWGCWKGSGSVCGSLHNEDSQLVCFDDKLTDPGLMLGHQSSFPQRHAGVEGHLRLAEGQHAESAGRIVLLGRPGRAQCRTLGQLARREELVQSWQEGRQVPVRHEGDPAVERLSVQRGRVFLRRAGPGRDRSTGRARPCAS